jgi:restriction endonuclease
MNQATPINKLQQQAELDVNSQGEELIDNVLKAMDKSEESAVSSVSVAPAPVQQQDDVSVASSNTESSAIINNAIKKTSSKDLVSSIEADEQAEKIIDDLVTKQNAKKGFVQRTLDEIKDPFMIIVLYVLFQSGIVSNLLNSVLGKYISMESGGYVPLLVKGFLFGLMYYVFKKLLA